MDDKHVRDAVGKSHCVSEREETEQERAERIVAEELARMGWELETKAQRGPEASEDCAPVEAGDNDEVEWIAERSETGAWTHLSECQK